MITRLLAAIERLLDAAATLLIAIILAAVAAQVVMRYGFNNATSWSDTVAAASMAWLSLLGATAAIRKGSNIAILSFSDRLSAAWRWRAQMICHVAVLIFSVVFLYSSVRLVEVSRNTIVEGLFVQVSWAQMYLVMVVCSVLMIVFTIERMVGLWPGKAR